MFSRFEKLHHQEPPGVFSLGHTTMIYDQAAHLERQRAEVADKLAKLQTGDWWHCGTWEEAHSRALAELNEIDYQILCLKAGMEPRKDDR